MRTDFSTQERGENDEFVTSDVHRQPSDTAPPTGHLSSLHYSEISVMCAGLALGSCGLR